MVYIIFAILSLFSLVFGLIFIILKNGMLASNFENRKIFLYNVHVTGSKFAVGFAFIHGYLMQANGEEIGLIGWLIGLCFLILLLIGALFSIKTKSKPMTKAQDHEWLALRRIKYLLTLILITSISFHLIS